MFNTISTNIALRRREFAMLKSVGLGQRGFKKMMNYECIIYGLKGIIYGLPVALCVRGWMWMNGLIFRRRMSWILHIFILYLHCRKKYIHYTVIVHMRDLMRYLGYGSSPSNEQIEVVRDRMHALSRVLGVLSHDAKKTYMSAEHLLMDFGFDSDNNVVFIHSPYMNKLVELISRDQIQRFYTTRNGVAKPVLENGNSTYYPAFTRLVHPDIASAKNKRAVEVVFAFAKLIVATGKQKKSAQKEKTPNISFIELMNRCYDLKVPIIDGKAQKLNDRKQRNKILRRTFKNVYEYLESYTSISDEYVFEKYIPTDIDDNYVFRFHAKKN